MVSANTRTTSKLRRVRITCYDSWHFKIFIPQTNSIYLTDLMLVILLF